VARLRLSRKLVSALRVSIAKAARLAALLGVAACSHVAPYERGVLARPDMTTSDLTGPAEQHVREVHEGAARGGAVAESGCGCN
jgi:hypothetical protein